MHPLINSIQEETGYREAKPRIDQIPSLANRIRGLEATLQENPTPALATRYRRLLSQAVAAAMGSAPAPPAAHHPGSRNGGVESAEVVNLKEEYNERLKTYRDAEYIMQRCDPQPLKLYEREEKALRGTLGTLIEKLMALGVRPSHEAIRGGFNLQGQQRLPMQ